MSRIASKYIRWGTSTGDVNASSMPSNRTATNYTPTDTTTKGHLDGIDTALGITVATGDIGLTSFSAANNQVSAANVTGLAFNNAAIRAFSATVSVAIVGTGNLFEVFELKGIQKDASWDMSVESAGDTSGITFSITSAGQVQYTSTDVAGFVSDTMEFRAITTHV